MNSRMKGAQGNRGNRKTHTKTHRGYSAEVFSQWACSGRHTSGHQRPLRLWRHLHSKDFSFRATVAYIVDMANAFSPVGAAAYRTSAAVELVLSCSRELGVVRRGCGLGLWLGVW